MHTFLFVPRPFPPPALADVPVEYIIDQLRRLAPHYWSKPETSDCTVVVPLDLPLTKMTAASGPPAVPEPVLQFDHLDAVADLEDPSSRPSPRMVMQLHMDYLCAHSTLLRGLLGGASPFDLLGAPTSCPPSRPATPKSRPESPHACHPAPQLPCLLPSTPTHPMIYLPVPDPVSFRLLVHYVYFGSTAFIEDALDRGELSWEGLARNVEYLGMSSEIKACLGRWYREWKRARTAGVSSADSDSDSEASDSDADTDVFEENESTATSATTATLFEFDDARDADDAKARYPPRGRNTTTRRLGHSTSDPQFGRSRAHDTPRTPRGRSE
ncbi:hypothetical protein B0H21DRAFT_687129 [Amylocystis lapponica]|nr:hypothetical protein B0H21DRAFT_687129 [Amylocystis lapponica]